MGSQRGQGLPQDQQSVFEQQFQDIESSQRLLEQEGSNVFDAYQQSITGLEGARDVASGVARTSALMPTYAASARSGRSGAYGGGQAQAASQAGRIGANRAAEVGSSFAQQLAQQHLQQQQATARIDRERQNLEGKKTELEAKAQEAVLKDTQARIKLINDEQTFDYGRVSALLREAQQSEGQVRLAFLQEAHRITTTGGMGGGRDAFTGVWLMKNDWAVSLLEEIGPI